VWPDPNQGICCGSFFLDAQGEFRDSSSLKKQVFILWDWARISHLFHCPFYCYSYIFGNLLSIILFQNYREKADGFLEAIIDLLRSGSSLAPMEMFTKMGLNPGDAPIALVHGCQEVTMLQLPGYEIKEKIFQGARYVLYRAVRSVDSAQVLVKTYTSDYPVPGDMARLQHEYDTTRELEVEGVLKPLALEKHCARIALIYEDNGRRPLKTVLAARKIDTETFLRFSIPLVETLGRLHQANIIHKNINPENIFIEDRTDRVELAGFDIASHLPKEEPGIIHPRILEGTLAYSSPEQTGRMNRSLDYRTDFYSLGVTFYEILTGQLPFASNDPLEQIHSHMALRPVLPVDIDPNVPQVISDIVIKLMAKTAEERYQSALGLVADLTESQTRLHRDGRIYDFPIGRHDYSKKLHIAEGLYGREQEIEVLEGLFRQAGRGNPQIVMVSGYAGIGKTSLVKEFYKSITQRSVYFISGKFDQLQRNIPYSAVIDALKSLVRELLTESRSNLDRWRKDWPLLWGPTAR